MQLTNKQITINKLQTINSKGDLYAIPYEPTVAQRSEVCLSAGCSLSKNSQLQINNTSLLGDNQKTVSQPKADEPLAQKRSSIMEKHQSLNVNNKNKNSQITLNTNISKRSNTMKYSAFTKSLSRGVIALLTIALIATMAMGQNLILHGNLTNAGTIGVGGNVDNQTGGAVVVDGAGIVRLQGTSAGTHDIKGGTAISFTNLDVKDSRPTALQVNTTVLDQLRIGYSGNTYTAGGNGFDVNSQTLTIGGAANPGTASYSGSAPLTFSGVVLYASGTATNQPVLTKTGGVSYSTLQFSGAGTKRVVTGGKVTVATLTHAGGQLSVFEDVDVTGSITGLANLGAIDAAKTLEIKSGATAVTMTSMNNSGTGTFKNSANIDITIPTLAGNSGVIDNAGTGSLMLENNLTNAGTITTATGKLYFDGAGTVANDGTISVTGAGHVYIAGDIATTPGTLNLNSASSTHFSGSAQNIATGVTYGNLIAEGTGAKTVGADITVAGNLTLTQNISQTSGKLTMTSTTPTNVSGAGEVIGAVRRLHDFASGQDYRFNRADVFIGTAAHSTADITLAMVPATNPTNGAPATKYVQRRYGITPTSAGNLENLQLYFATGELQGGLDATKVGLRAYSASWAKVNYTTQTRTSGSNVMTYTALNNSLSGVSEFGMAAVAFKTLADGANLSNASAWDENTLPTSTDDIVIASNNVTVGTTPLSVATLTIESGKLTIDQSSAAMTVTGLSTIAGELVVDAANATLANVDVTGGGKLTVGTGRTISAATVAHSTSSTSIFTGDVIFTDLVNTSGTVQINGGASTIGTMSGTGNISVGGTLGLATASASNVTYNGNLTIAGTMNVGTSSFASGLKLDGTSKALSLTGALNVHGDLEVGSGVSLTNNGTITVGD